MDLADRLAQARKAKKLSQRRLSKAAGLSESYVSLIENRQRTNIGPRTLDALGAVLGVSPLWLKAGEVAFRDSDGGVAVRQGTVEEAIEAGKDVNTNALLLEKVFGQLDSAGREAVSGLLKRIRDGAISASEVVDVIDDRQREPAEIDAAQELASLRKRIDALAAALEKKQLFPPKSDKDA